MKFSTQIQAQIEARHQAGDFNLLDGNQLVASLDVWATRLYEEFWDGYGLAGGELFFDAELCPADRVLEAIEQKQIGLSLGLETQLKQFVNRSGSGGKYLLDLNYPQLFDLIFRSERFTQENTKVHIFSYEYFISLWKEGAFAAHFNDPDSIKPEGHWKLKTVVSSWANNPQWYEFKAFLKLGRVCAGRLELPIYESADGQSSLTLVVESWGKYLPVESYHRQAGLFRDLLKLAKLGLTNFDLMFIFEMGGIRQLEVNALIDHTEAVRDLADQLRKFMANKDTRKAGVKTPQIGFLGIPGWESAPYGFVTSDGVEVGRLESDYPLYIVAGEQLEETDYATSFAELLRGVDDVD
ncbi:hypothetical protein NXS08_01080 [Gleimia sp. 6138-11-ORH1]|uniref:hypothetical protein n=1 Tax=Gleimia sp. 6138-11-ORH1 TaxID=2973937 RepID=UPI002169252F|nr:hypothetical protein [Gleimia sp. 6138-11-ORH1]MCS4484085.1 hypothetical protein [Gleimia sp. 6138-11-ORH1]